MFWAIQDTYRELSRFGRLAAIAAWVALPTAAFAQEAVPEAPESTDGQIIYSRDVAYGSAIERRTPGREHSVSAGPTDLILASLTSGLEPISDVENASIAAGPSSYAGLAGQNVSLSMQVITNLNSAGSATTNLGNIQSTVIGGAIGQVNGVMQNAMGSVRGALSGALGGSQ